MKTYITSYHVGINSNVFIKTYNYSKKLTIYQKSNENINPGDRVYLDGVLVASDGKYSVSLFLAVTVMNGTVVKVSK